jgi:RNA polymerase sigma-70 factor (ECF subfamily)
MAALSTLPLTKTDSAADEERLLVERLASQDAATWRQVFETYFGRLAAFAFVRTGDRSAAEDIAAATLAVAVKRIRSFRYTGAPISAWLFRIARNQTADYLNHRRRRPSVPLEAVEDSVDGNNDSLGRVEAVSDLRSAFASLKREHQELLALRFIYGLSPTEVAEAMGKSTGSVKVMQHRAAAALKKAMHEGTVAR